MSHHHDRHTHDHNNHATLSDKEKLIKMIDHWIQHNLEHANSYRDWAERAKDLGQAEVAKILEKIATETTLQNEDMGNALELLKKD